MADEDVFGARQADGQFVFSCAQCDGVAARLRLVSPDEAVDLPGPPGGGAFTVRAEKGPTVAFEFIAASTRAASVDLVELLQAAERLTAAQLRRVDWDLTAFVCHDCGLAYCPSCWTTWPLFDDGFYDCTRGSCPMGHEQDLDD